MRKEKLKNQWRLYLNPHDYSTLVDTVREDYPGEKGDYAELAIRLGAESGLRVSETNKIQVNDVRDSTHPSVEMRFLRVRETKATSGDYDDGKYRSTVISESTLDWLHQVAERWDRSDDEPVIDRCKRSIQKYIKQAGKLAYNRTGEEDFVELSSHDLRAFAATNWLIRHDMNKEVVKTIGGWKNYQNLKPYLDKPGDDVIAREFTAESGPTLADGYRYEDRRAPDPEEPTETEQTTIFSAVD